MAAGREARLRARRRPAHQPGGGGRPPRERDGHVVCEPGACCRAHRAARPGAHEGCTPDPARTGRGNRPAEARRDGRGDRYADARAAEVPGVVGDGDLSPNQIQVRVAHLGLDRTTNTPAVILGLGADLRKVIITQVKDNTYYAELHIYRGDAVIQIDARPSDSIAVALRLKAPIFTSENLLALTSIETAEAGGESGPAALDADALKTYLQNLDPEDFGKFTP